MELESYLPYQLCHIFLSIQMEGMVLALLIYMLLKSRNTKPVLSSISVTDRYGAVPYHIGFHIGPMKLQKIFFLFHGYIV